MSVCRFCALPGTDSDPLLTCVSTARGKQGDDPPFQLHRPCIDVVARHNPGVVIHVQEPIVQRVDSTHYNLD